MYIYSIYKLNEDMAVRFEKTMLLRLSESEKERIQRCAEMEGVKPAQFVRDAIKEKLDSFERKRPLEKGL